MPMARQWKGLLRPQTNDWQTNLGYLIGSAISNNIVQKREAQDQANMYQDMAGLGDQFDQLGAPQTKTADNNAPALVRNYNQDSFGTGNFQPGLMKGAAAAAPAYGGDTSTDSNAGGLLSSPQGQYSFDQTLQQQQHPQRTMDSVNDYAKNVQTTTTPGASPMDRTKLVRNQIPQVLAAMAKKYPGKMGTIGPMVMQVANQKVDDLNQQYTQQQLASSMDGFNQAVSNGDRAAMVQHAVSLGRLGVKGIPELLKFASPEKNYGFMFAPDGTMMVTDKNTGNVRMEGSPGQYAKGPTTIYHVGGGGRSGGGGGGRSGGGGRVAASPMDKYGASMNYVNDQALFDEYQTRVENGDFLTPAEQHKYNQAAARLNAYQNANGGYGQDESADYTTDEGAGDYTPQEAPPQAQEQSQEEEPTAEEIALYKQMYGL